MARIVVLTNLYPPHHYGGYELVCRDVVERWRARGHEVAVVTSTYRVPGVADMPEEHGVDRVLRFYWDDHEVLDPPFRTRVAWERANLRAWRAVLDRFRPDVVSVWNHGTMSYVPLAEAAARTLPMVLVIGDTWPCWGPSHDRWTRMFTHHGLPGRALGGVVRALTGIPTTVPDLGRDAVALPASRYLASAIEAGSPFRFRRLEVVPHGIDTAVFDPALARPDRRFGWRLLYAGRIEPRKGVETLLRALPGLPEARLEVLGRGEAAYEQRCRALAAELGVADRVAFTAVDRPGLAERMRAADVVVVPSEWDEPFGLVPIEAMACGAVVVGTGTGGAGEVLDDEVNGLRFERGDSDALAAALRRVADDEALRRRLVAAGRATAGRLTVDAMAEALERWHLRAIEERRAS